MRIEPLVEATLTEEQKTVIREASDGPRGHMPRPMLGWMSNPELARRTQHLGALLRYGTSLPPRLSELVILITARHWGAAHAWQAHKKDALKGGLELSIIDAVAARRRPDFPARDGEILYDFCTAMITRHHVDEAQYAATFAAFGEAGIAEIVGLIGYYTTVSLTLNVFEFGVPAGMTPEITHDD